jgi:hypothetical protein
MLKSYINRTPTLHNMSLRIRSTQSQCNTLGEKCAPLVIIASVDQKKQAEIVNMKWLESKDNMVTLK